MSAPLVVAEKGQIKPKSQKELRDRGYVVLIVDDISKVLLVGASNENTEDDGFNLDAETP